MKWKMVPVEPTHAMERAYFSAPMPTFKRAASSGARKRNNGRKMKTRWAAMLAAAPEFEPDDKMVERASRCFQMTLYAQLGSTPADAVRAALKAALGGEPKP